MIRLKDHSLAADEYNATDTYEVSSVRHEGNTARFTSVVDSLGSKTNGWASKHFELVPQEKPATVLGTQIGGSHYTDCAIQPIEYIWANKLGFSEGNIVKYVTRWRTKGGVKDLEKAKHHIALLIERTLADEAKAAS